MLTVAPAQTSRFEKEQTDKKKEVEIIDWAGGGSKSQPKAHAIKLRKKKSILLC